MAIEEHVKNISKTNTVLGYKTDIHLEKVDINQLKELDIPELYLVGENKDIDSFISNWKLLDNYQETLKKFSLIKYPLDRFLNFNDCIEELKNEKTIFHLLEKNETNEGFVELFLFLLNFDNGLAIYDRDMYLKDIKTHLNYLWVYAEGETLNKARDTLLSKLPSNKSLLNTNFVLGKIFEEVSLLDSFETGARISKKLGIENSSDNIVIKYCNWIEYCGKIKIGLMIFLNYNNTKVDIKEIFYQ